MAKIIFVSHSGDETTVDADDSMSLMTAALDNGVAGIDADCGGECSCATCHVLIDESWGSKIDGPTEQEESMLDLNPDREARSRLACQIPVSDAIDGITVNLPEFQY